MRVGCWLSFIDLVMILSGIVVMLGRLVWCGEGKEEAKQGALSLLVVLP